MFSLRLIASQPHTGETRVAKAPGDRRGRPDRRAFERRNHLYPFENRESRLRFAAQAVGIGTYDLDCATGDSVWSPELRALAGLPPDDAPLSTEQAEGLIHPEDRQRFLDKLQASLDPGGRGEFEDDHRLLRPDGTVRWVRTKGHTFFIGQGDGRRPLASTGVVMDMNAHRVDDEKLADSQDSPWLSKENPETGVAARMEELMRTNLALERSNQELQQFALIAAHDLQSPLSSISGFAQLLKNDFFGQLGAAADSWLDQLVRSAQLMGDMIRDVLAYSRLESRGESLQPVDFNQLFDDVVVTLDAPIREMGAMVVRGDLPTLPGDRAQLAQVLQNLVENALKYRSDEPPEVCVSAGRQGLEWVFSVRDNGIGIPKRHLENIFDIFRRLPTLQSFPGTGLGLAICRRVIHRHRGRIWAESKPGKGSIFYFTLPERH